MEQSQPSHGVTVEDYMSSLGQTATVDAYMTQARQQSRALWRTEYTAGAFNTWAEQAFGLTAAPSCYPNCDGSTAAPILNVLDFSCFLQKYAAADPYANCDGSTTAPVLNVLDFTCFLQKFAQGCHTDPGSGG
jgi:hypothetical protein